MDAGKKTRFEISMLPHLGSAYRLARWLAGNDDIAQDVVQEAYLRAYRFFDGFQGDNARGWLLTIVRHVWFDHRGHAWPRTEDEFDEGLHGEGGDLDAYSDPLMQLERESGSALVRRALATLPEHFREILLLREHEELSYRQIAALLNLPIGTVMSRLARAREALARALEPQLSDLR